MKSRLKLKIAHDGDVLSMIMSLTDEAVKEQQAFFGKRAAWLDPSGGMLASFNTETVALVFKNMTMEPLDD